MKNNETKSVFEVLSAIDCNSHAEKKNGLTYLPWAWAWQMVKQNYPDATYKIYEADNGCFYHTDGTTCWVKTGVTIEGLEMVEYLPIMDFRNASIPRGKVTSFDANKAIQRSLTKACARHGLGIYIYAGEDLPEGGEAPQKASTSPKKKPAAPAKSNGDDDVTKAAKAAWAAFRATPTALAMDENSRSKYFIAMIKEATGFADPHALTVDDWGKVMGKINHAEVLV